MLSYELDLIPSKTKKLSQTATIYYTELGLRKWFNGLANAIITKLMEEKEIPVYREVDMDDGKVKEIEIKIKNPFNYFLRIENFEYENGRKKSVKKAINELNLVGILKKLTVELRECNPFVLENYLKLKIGVKDKRDLGRTRPIVYYNRAGSVIIDFNHSNII